MIVLAMILSLMSGAVAGWFSAREFTKETEEKADRALRLENSTYDMLNNLVELEKVHWNFSRQKINKLLCERGYGKDAWLTDEEKKAQEMNNDRKGTE